MSQQAGYSVTVAVGNREKLRKRLNQDCSKTKELLEFITTLGSFEALICEYRHAAADQEAPLS